MNRRPRSEFSKATKTAAWDRSGGRCEICTAKLFPGRFIYDHVIPTALGGEATLENCAVICKACNAVKTSSDQSRISKARDVEEKHLGMRKPGGFPRTYKGRPIKHKIGGGLVWRDSGEPVR